MSIMDCTALLKDDSPQVSEIIVYNWSNTRAAAVVMGVVKEVGTYTGECEGGMCPKRKSVWGWNKVCERLLVKWSDKLILMSICSSSIRSRSTYSQSEKYLISM
jgi:hypothetical protein